MKIQKGQVIEELAFKALPGSGAIEFMKSVLDLDGCDIYDAMLLLRELEEESSEIFQNKRVRPCCACGYLFYDHSKPNSAVVCSEECRSRKNVYLRKLKRREQAIENGTKREMARDNHYSHEYGFWSSDERLMETEQRHFVDTDDLEKTVARSQQRQLMGGKKRSTSQNIDDIQSTTTRRSREFWGTTWATAYDDEK